MGLDVYLKHYKRPFDEVQKLREAGAKAYEDAGSETLAKLGVSDFGKLTKNQHKNYFEEVKRVLAAAGFDEYGDVTDSVVEKIERDSAVYPGHMFKVGYLRSSYNDSGINRVLRDRIGKDLGYIFQVGEGEDEYHRRVDWPAALKRAREVRDDLARSVVEHGPYSVMEFAPNMFSGGEELRKFPDRASVMARFQEERRRHGNEKGPLPSYGNGDGEWFMGEPLQVVAMVPGSSNGFRGRTPTMYAVVKLGDVKKDDGTIEPPFTWYKQATEIVVEMCEWVLGQSDPSAYILHWSS